MPHEVGLPPTLPTDESIGAAYLAQAVTTLAEAHAKIGHCLAQLRDEDLWWRPHESHNSLQNILLHLCGNLRQWIVHGVGGAADVRNRPQEFADRQPHTKHELQEKLAAVVAEASAVLQSLPPNRLLERRNIQTFDTTVLTAVFETVSHFVGHTHQVVYITRLRLGDKYVFQWVPPPAGSASAPREQ